MPVYIEGVFEENPEIKEELEHNDRGHIYPWNR